jgi:hypothetical protein
MLNEADTCREFVVPKLSAVGEKERKIIEIMERVEGLLEKGKA